MWCREGSFHKPVNPAVGNLVSWPTPLRMRVIKGQRNLQAASSSAAAASLGQAQDVWFLPSLTFCQILDDDVANKASSDRVLKFDTDD